MSEQPMITGRAADGEPVAVPPVVIPVFDEASGIIFGPAGRGKSGMTAAWAAELTALDARQVQDLIAEMGVLVIELDRTPWWRLLRTARLNSEIRLLSCEIHALQVEIVHLDEIIQAAR